MYFHMEHFSPPVYISILIITCLLGIYAIVRYKGWRWLTIPTFFICAAGIVNRLVQDSAKHIDLHESVGTAFSILGILYLVYFFVGTYLFIKRKKRETQTQHDKERTTNKKK